jgi:chemotaxis protein methyltransferase CheR/type IV pilus assembly protein PilK
MRCEVVETSKKPKLFGNKFPDMDNAQYVQWTELLEARTGIRLPEKRRSFLVTNVGMRMRELGFDDYQQYFEHINTGQRGKVEWDRLVHHLTVHETRFLRHEETLALITTKVLPQKIQDCPKKPLTINAWSVGCASGEEPYSIAMAIDDHMQRLGCDYYLGVIGSDISRSALAVGRQGLYTFKQVKNIKPHWLQKYFNRTADGKYQVAGDLRQRVCFTQTNVLDMGKMPIGYMDIIVCQNLLIYYERQRREAIVNNLINYLAPGGILILAVGELLNWCHPDMERFPFANTLAYRRKKGQ